MFDIGLSQVMIIGVVALVVIGPEKLPRVARTIGTLFGRVQRYVNDVKAEVSEQIELDEFTRFKTEMEQAARGIESQFEKSMQETSDAIEASWNDSTLAASSAEIAGPKEAVSSNQPLIVQTPSVKRKRVRERKVVQGGVVNWRSERAAMPIWYKRRTHVRGKLRSCAAKRATKHLLVW